MDAKAKVINYLGLWMGGSNPPTVKVCEWAFVYWVHVSGNRPTMLSKKIVDRYSEFEVLDVVGDRLIRDNKTNSFYCLRSPGFYCGSEWNICQIKKGTRISSGFPLDFATLKGDKFKALQNSKPQNIKELLIRRAIAA